MDGTTQQVAGALILIAYMGLVVIALASMVVRAVRFRSVDMEVPRLLIRDLILIGGHAMALFLILGARFLVVANLVEAGTLMTNPIWWLVTAGPPMVAIATYVYYELFIIK